MKLLSQPNLRPTERAAGKSPASSLWRAAPLLLLAMAAMVAPSFADSPFACNRAALSAKARARHFDELSPALRARKKSIRELQYGFEFEFPPDTATFQLVAEWVAGERLCCPFFDIDIRVECEGGSLWLRLTGREGVKQFIRADFVSWFPA